MRIVARDMPIGGSVLHRQLQGDGTWGTVTLRDARITQRPQRGPDY